MSKGHVLILGAKSDIAMAIAHRFAKAGHPIQLAARDVQSLETARADIAVRYDVAVGIYDFDALAVDSHAKFATDLDPLPQIVICVVGYMGEQSENERKMQETVTVMRSNYEGPASILGVFANHFEERGSGVLVGISSVAGERGRATNYVYGSAKAGFTAFLSGLRNRLAKKNVHVLTVLPGFVATKMTEGLDLPAKLTAQPSEVGETVFDAVRKGRNVVYVRKIWFVIMTIITNIPERVFKKLSI
jgi:short-subunit dehydrogenase